MSEVDTSAEVWLILKRGYYYRPDNCGYTAIKSEAGRYSLEETAVHFPNESDSGLSFIHEDKADDYSPACDVITKLQHQNKILRQERDELALVIMGGEDAPGLAASLSVEELQKLQLDNQASAKAFHEYDLSQARSDALEEAIVHFQPDDMDSESTRSHCEYAQRELRNLKSQEKTS